MTRHPDLDDALPRLSGALQELSAQLNRISQELHTLTEAQRTSAESQQATQPGEPAAPADLSGAPGAPGTPADLSGTPTDPGAPEHPGAPTAPPAPWPAPWPGQPAPPYAAAQTQTSAGPYVHQAPYGHQAPPPYPGAPYAPGPYPPPQPYTPPPPKPKLSERLGQDGAGSKLLVWIGGAVTLVGVVLMMILAIQRGWIGPVPRVLLGAVLATGLIGISLRAHRSPTGRTGAYALAATGFAALFLDVVAATTLLDLLPQVLGQFLALLVTATGMALAARWQAQPLAVFVLVGSALCAPVLTEGFGTSLVVFLLILQVGTIPVQLMRDWMWVPLAAGAPLLLMALVSVQWMARQDQLATSVVLAVVASLLVSVSAVVTSIRRPEDPVPLILLIASPAPTLLLTPHLSDQLAAVTAVLLALPLAVVWVLGRSSGTPIPKPISAAAGGVTAVCVLFASAELLPGDARAVGLLGESLLLSYAAVRLKARGVLLSATGFAGVGAMVALATVATPERVLQPPALPPGALVLVLGALAFGLLGGASLALVLARVQLDRPDAAGAGRPELAWTQVLSGITTLYGATGFTLCLALLVSPDRTGFLLGHTVVTVSWMVAALILLQRGITRRGPRIAGLVLVGAALLKLVLFDLAALDGVARVATFLGAGLVLLGAGVRYTRLVSDQQQLADQRESITNEARTTAK